MDSSSHFPSLAALRRRWPDAIPVGFAAVVALAVLLWDPVSTDLSSHRFRGWLFGQAPFGPWNNRWFGGHHTLGYSLLAPLAAGVAPDDIVMGLWASGDFHFGKPNYDWEPAPSEVVYTNFGAPPLLFQAAFGFDDTPADNRGVDILGLPGISVKDGQITLYVYAGWYS